MGLRGWGVALLLMGALTIAGGIFGGFEARAAYHAAEDACAGSTDEFCGAGQTYAAAMFMVVSPLLAIPGLLMLLVGGGLLALRRAIDRTLARAPVPLAPPSRQTIK